MGAVVSIGGPGSRPMGIVGKTDFKYSTETWFPDIGVGELKPQDPLPYGRGDKRDLFARLLRFFSLAEYVFLFISLSLTRYYYWWIRFSSHLVLLESNKNKGKAKVLVLGNA